MSLLQADLLERWPRSSSDAQLVAVNLVLEDAEDMTPVFAEATRVLAPGGHLFVSERHPFKQYRGSEARFVDAPGATVPIAAFRHQLVFTRKKRARRRVFHCDNSQ